MGYHHRALAELEKLRREIDYRILEPPVITKQETDVFFVRLGSAWDEADKAWVKTYASK